MSQTDVRDYLDTLRRIPDDIFLAVFAHDFDEGDGAKCLCGWAMREGMARIIGIDADATTPTEYIDSSEACVAMYGGTSYEWSEIYHGVTQPYKAPWIECAVVDRLSEIVP